MKALLLGAALLLATALMAQQQPHPPYQPPSSAPQTVTPDQPQEPMPPDTQAPAHRTLSSSAVQQQIDGKIGDEPGLAGSNIKVNVDDSSVVLTGTVDSEQQHDLALRIAQAYAGDRPIDDKIQIRGHA
jgi:hyperosmotically inducible protein